MHELQDRRILVTGAGSGIGKSTAERFAAEGAKLALLDINKTAIAERAEALGGVAVVGDVRDEKSVIDATGQAVDQLGGLDGLVNAAGVGMSANLEDLDMDHWRRVIDINLTGTYVACRAALPFLRQAEEATIVNVASGTATRAGPGRSAYTASKAGVVAFTRCIAIELAPRIRVNAILPGAVETPLLRGMISNPAAREALEARYAMKRVGQPEEIANAILFMTSKQSSFMTGSPMIVDGGQ
ncbi:SDR family oxidoreductase [Alphaproteobacteria bacterium]|nr:SDR family oxidoreductase [Alphaproteobacteria bacterium]